MTMTMIPFSSVAQLTIAFCRYGKQQNLPLQQRINRSLFGGRVKHLSTPSTRQFSDMNNINDKSSCSDDAAEASSSSSSLMYTPISSIAPLVNVAHQTYHTRITHSYEFRISQLRGIERLIRENTDALSHAISQDLCQGAMYAEAFELSHVISRSRYAQSNLRSWMKSQHTPTPFPMNLNIPVYSTVEPIPRGVVTIITPWNLPIQLTLNPLMDALCAGNVCIVKMSERCVHCTKLLSHLLTCGKYVDDRVVKVVIGGADEATELLEQRVDVISYTGGITVGRKVALAAAKHLTPVLLELGGKNPVFVTRNAHLPSAAMRIAWGKITGNAGQMCVCPEYVRDIILLLL
jgi:acyl-CoA reductase-like NAD-dependent aldehyde dehydrogenase